MMGNFLYSRSLTVSFGAVLIGLSACEKPAPPAPYPFALRVTADGEGLSGANVFLGKQLVGATDAAGRVAAAVHGEEGSVAQFSVECPDGYKSPTTPVIGTLRRQSRTPQFDIDCAPTMRTVVVAVRAANGPHLPILHLGEQVGRTDASGAANVLFKVAPSDSLQVVLDASSDPHLKPQSPSANFTVADHDQLFVFDTKFVTDKPKVVAAPHRAAAPTGPVRMEAR